MKIRYLPESATSINEVLHLSGAVKNLIDYARRDFVKDKRSLYSLLGGDCGECKLDLLMVDIHHVKPMWVYAVEAILETNPKSIDDIKLITRLAFRGQLHILPCNEPSNLRTLCRRCHNKVETRAEAYWKEQLLRRRVMFRYSHFRQMGLIR